jgi:hypothetical protein
MSVPVPLDELPEQIERFGPYPYLVTVAPDGRPRATSVSVSWQRDRLHVGAGRRTTANVAANAAVALLWPAPQPGEHALIVDGHGAVGDAAQSDGVVLVEPGRAVLHVTSPRRTA